MFYLKMFQPFSCVSIFNFEHAFVWKTLPQPIFTCSKSTIEVLEKGGKYVQS